jgi:hypothetical protein
VTTSTISYVIWGVLLAAALLLWWLSYRRPDSVARPAVVVSALVTHPVLRVCLVLGWMFLGWHLFAR